MQARGLPAVLVTLAGEGGPGAARAVSQDRLQEMGRTVLRTITALDGRAQPIPGPRAELFLSRKLVPTWAIRLVVGTLILPALLAALDGFARVRRRIQQLGPYQSLALLLVPTCLVSRSRLLLYLWLVKGIGCPAQR